MCGDAEACTLWFETHPVAAKEHRCAECRQVIPKGTKHVRFKSLFEGSWDDQRICEPCRAAWTEHITHMREVHKQHCLITIGGLAECKSEHDEWEPCPPSPPEPRGRTMVDRYPL